MIRSSTAGMLIFLLICVATGLADLQTACAQTTAREKILDSPEWKKAMQDLEQWSSVQQIYDQQQLAEKKQQLEKKIAGMSADQLTAFLADLKQKLAILHSDEARKARAWLDETMAVAAPAYAKKIRAGLPDVVDLTAAQLQLQLDAFDRRIAESQKASAEYAQLREQQAKQIRDQRIRDEQARTAAKIAEDTAPRSNYNVVVPRTYNLPAPIAYPFLWGGYRW